MRGNKRKEKHICAEQMELLPGFSVDSKGIAVLCGKTMMRFGVSSEFDSDLSFVNGSLRADHAGSIRAEMLWSAFCILAAALDDKGRSMLMQNEDTKILRFLLRATPPEQIPKIAEALSLAAQFVTTHGSSLEVHQEVIAKSPSPPESIPERALVHRFVVADFYALLTYSAGEWDSKARNYCLRRRHEPTPSFAPFKAARCGVQAQGIFAVCDMPKDSFVTFYPADRVEFADHVACDNRSMTRGDARDASDGNILNVNVGEQIVASQRDRGDLYRGHFASYSGSANCCCIPILLPGGIPALHVGLYTISDVKSGDELTVHKRS